MKKIILHLMSTDWQRFKRLVIALWAAIVVTALPWLLHTPWKMPMPQSFGYGSNSELETNPADLGEFEQSGIVAVGCLFVSLLAFILAARLGMQWGQYPAMPIRRRERLPALAASLLAFIILPLWGAMFLNLCFQGFGPGTAALAALSQSGSIFLFVGLVAAFGAWCPTVWQFLAGLAALFSIAGFAREMQPGYQPRLLGYVSNFFLLPAGPAPWLFGLLAIGLLAALLPVCRGRLNAAVRIATAVTVVLAAAVIVVYLPKMTLASPKVAQLPPAGIAGIQPQIVEPQFRRDGNLAGYDDRLSFFAEINANGCPPGLEVEWQVIGQGWISQDGKRIGSNVEPAGKSNYAGPEDSAGCFIPRNEASTNRAALAALSGENHNLPTGRTENHYLTSFGRYAFSQPLLAKSDAELQVDLTGTVYRYETVWDVPLTEETVEKQIDGTTWRIRRYPSPTGKLRADVLVTHPAIGFSTDPEKVRWDASPFEGGRLYFITASGEAIPAGDDLAQIAGPMLGGAGWHRKILGPTARNGPQKYTANLRLVLLKPVIVARIHRTTSVTFRPWQTGDVSDFDLMLRYGLPTATYREDWFPGRPDPRTCSQEEFARWLRVAAMAYAYRDPGSERDLATFAPRFARLMARAGDHTMVTEGLRLGTPESRRDDVIGQFDTVPQVEKLAETALRRGWLDEAREPMLRRFRKGEVWNSVAMLALEEPSTYPELINRFISRPEREMFEKLRLLPGIGPQLRDTVAKAAREINPSPLQFTPTSSRRQDPYGVFLYAAKQGDAAAFEAMLAVYQSREDDRYPAFRDLGYVLSMPDLPDKRYQALAVWLHGKSAASFRFDPLLRLWQLLP